MSKKPYKPKAFTPKASIPKVEKSSGEGLRGYALRPSTPRSRKTYPIASLLLEYLELPPPRSLVQLAAHRGLEAIPDEWKTRSQLEQWTEEADRYDAAINENRIRNNWTAANETQSVALALTDRLLREISEADPTDRDLTQGLSALATTVKTLVGVRVGLMEGLEKPDSQSAIELPQSLPIGQLELF